MRYVPTIGDRVVVVNDTTNIKVYGNGYTGYITHVESDATCKVDNKIGGWLGFESVKPRKESRNMQEEISLQNVKFDMKAIAEELGVSLEKAHNIVQTALFEKGVEWPLGAIVTNKHATWLFVTTKGIKWGVYDDEPSWKLVSIKPRYSFYVKEEMETIEFNGKQYNKEDVAKALALLSPIN